MKKLEPHPIANNPELHHEDGNGTNGPTVCLITALTVADFIDYELVAGSHANTGAQLGVLTLAAILRQKGIRPHIVNLDDLFIDFLKRSAPEPVCSEEEKTAGSTATKGDRVKFSMPEQWEYFFPFVVEHLKPLFFDVFGLSSICSSYPLTLRLAQTIKEFNPEAKIILGGPQASVVDVATMRAFPCIDFIVRGEADETFTELLRHLSSADHWESIPGITFRRDADVIRNQNASPVHDLDCLPLPAFDLDAQIKDRTGIHLEIGRGCPFACTFCSTNDFFRRNFRLKSPQKTVEEMKFLNQEYGFTYFSFVHDMYTVDRKKVVAFCEALRQSRENFTWGCSARTDCIDDELIGLMAETGCRGIFFGIETGSQRLQQVIHKKLDLAEARKRIQCADQHGVRMAVALIVGFPEETRDDLRDTIHFFIDSLRFDHAEPQASLLAPLAATPIYEQYKDQLVFDHIFSDISDQGWRQDPAEVEMIKKYPEIFPNFYAIPLILLDRSYLRELMNFVRYVTVWFRWLPVALLQDSGDFLKVFELWRGWLAQRSARHSDENMGFIPYYSHQRFRHEFVEFVQTCYLQEMATARTAIAALVETESIFNPAKHSSPSMKAIDTDNLDAHCVPYQPHNLFMMKLGIDYQELIQNLRNKSDLSQTTEREVTLAFDPIDEKNIRVWQIAPLSESLLKMCDGRRTVSEIVHEFSQLEIGIDGVPADKACLFGLMQLCKDGLISVSSNPLIPETDTGSNECEKASAPLNSLHAQTTNTQQPWPPSQPH